MKENVGAADLVVRPLVGGLCSWRPDGAGRMQGKPAGLGTLA